MAMALYDGPQKLHTSRVNLINCTWRNVLLGDLICSAVAHLGEQLAKIRVRHGVLPWGRHQWAANWAQVISRICSLSGSHAESGSYSVAAQVLRANMGASGQAASDCHLRWTAGQKGYAPFNVHVLYISISATPFTHVLVSARLWHSMSRLSMLLGGIKATGGT